MEIDNFLSNGWVRRWTLIDGRPRCIEDAIAPDSPGALAALQRAEAVRGMVAEVEAFEAARLAIAAGPPGEDQPREIQIEIAEGQTQTAPNPVWGAYDAAVAAVAAVQPAIAALADWRAGEAVSDDTGHSEADDEAEAAGADWEAARAAALAEFEIRAARPLERDPRPAPHLSFLAFMGLFPPAEQMAIVGSTDTRVRLFALMASGAAFVDMAHPDVIAGVQYLAALGLIDAARVPAILAAQPPA